MSQIEEVSSSLSASLNGGVNLWTKLTDVVANRRNGNWCTLACAPTNIAMHCAVFPSKGVNWRFEPDFYHGPHFQAVSSFQTEIFGDCQLHRFTFEYYLGTS